MLKKYILDLDKPPNTRWSHIISDQFENFIEIQKYHSENMQKYSFFSKKIISNIVSSVKFDPQYYQELEGIHKSLAQKSRENVDDPLKNLSLNDLILLNSGYEFGCTSISTQGYLLRNMDWELDFLEKMTIQVDFYEKNILKFSCVTWPGLVGVFTGMNSKFAASINYRKTLQSNMSLTFKKLFNTYKLNCIVLRDALQGGLDYNQAVEHCKSSNILGSVYFNLVGHGENCVVVRGPSTNEVIKDFVVQTNHDLQLEKLSLMEISKWADGDQLLLSSIERKEKALELVSDFDPENPFYILNQYPISNNCTVYSCVMHPGKSIFLAQTTPLL